MSESKNTSMHPVRAAREIDYAFLRLAYLGGQDYMMGYLTHHPKERDAAWARRLERAVYPNLCRVQVQTYTAQLYRSPVTRSVAANDAAPTSAAPASAAVQRADKMLSRLWTDADRLGSDMDRVMAEVASWCQVLGSCGVLCDRTVAPDGQTPITAADEEEMGLRPYFEIVPPDSLIDWDVDETGRYRWVIFAREANEPRNPLDPPPAAPAYTHVLWTTDEVVELEWAGEAGKGGGWSKRANTSRPNPLGVVPLEMVYWGDRVGRHPCATSALSDLAPMNRRLMNLLSLVDEEIYQHVFNILMVGERTFEFLQSAQWSVAGVLRVAENENPPAYLAPGTEQIKAIADEVSSCMRFMRTLAGNPGRGPDDGLVPPSGVSLAYQSSDKFALFKEFSNRMQDLEERLYDLALAWEGIDPTSVAVSVGYSQDFDPVLVARTFEDALAFKSLALGGQAEIENELQVMRRYFGGSLSPEALSDLLEEHRQRRERELGVGAAGEGTTPANSPADNAPAQPVNPAAATTAQPPLF